MSLCAVERCSKLEALRRRTRGRRVSSEYVAQRWTATVPTSDQLCCWRWKSGRDKKNLREFSSVSPSKTVVDVLLWTS